MQTNCTKAEVEHLARTKFKLPALVREFNIRFDGYSERWIALSVGGEIIGARRTLEQLPALINRGHCMQVLADAKVRPYARDYQNRVPEDTRSVVGI